MRTLLDLKDAKRTQMQTAIVARERDSYYIDIAAFHDTRVERQGMLQENTILSSGYGKSLEQGDKLE